MRKLKVKFGTILMACVIGFLTTSCSEHAPAPKDYPLVGTDDGPGKPTDPPPVP